jgi:hypothetical protein
MDSYRSDTGAKLIGIGEAVVLGVQTAASKDAHQVIINHPDLGTTAYIPYIPAAGLYRVPRIGDICYVFCNENFHQYPVAWGHRISPELAKQLIGDRADNITVIYSSGPNNNSVTHKIELDDGTDPGIRIKTESGHIVNLSNAGNISVTHKDGPKLTLTDSLILLEAGGSTLTLNKDGLSVVSSKGSTLDVKETIKGRAADARSNFDEVTVATHSHTGNLGYPTSIPSKG